MKRWRKQPTRGGCAFRTRLVVPRPYACDKRAHWSVGGVPMCGEHKRLMASAYLDGKRWASTA